MRRAVARAPRHSVSHRDRCGEPRAGVLPLTLDSGSPPSAPTTSPAQQSPERSAVAVRQTLELPDSRLFLLPCCRDSKTAHPLDPMRTREIYCMHSPSLAQLLAGVGVSALVRYGAV